MADAVVVITSLTLELTLRGIAQEVASLLIFFRLWRILRVMHGVAGARGGAGRGGAGRSGSPLAGPPPGGVWAGSLQLGGGAAWRVDVPAPCSGVLLEACWPGGGAVQRRPRSSWPALRSPRF